MKPLALAADCARKAAAAAAAAVAAAAAAASSDSSHLTPQRGATVQEKKECRKAAVTG
jgi:Spy/CpxP family protein refolding chaperone